MLMGKLGFLMKFIFSGTNETCLILRREGPRNEKAVLFYAHLLHALDFGEFFRMRCCIVYVENTWSLMTFFKILTFFW
jgi:hypothetical protein